MRVYIVVEDYEVGHRITSLNICNICSTEEQAYKKRDKLLKDYDYICDDFRVEEWEVEE